MLMSMEIKLKELRRALHHEPELSGNEVRTAEKLKAFLAEQNPGRLVTGLGGNGILAVYSGTEPGRSILLRCDTDAVPVQEELNEPYISVKAGVSHKCGHDGHMAIMAGVAARLHRNPPRRGRVMLLFQPAEETGQGAAAVLADEKFQAFEPDIVFALHNLPGFPMHSVITTSGPFANASQGLILRLTGKSSHAGEPLRGISPAPAVAELIQGFQSICRHEEGVIITLIHALIGEVAFGTSPENAVVMATLRAPTGPLMDSLAEEVMEMVEETATAHRLKLRTEFTEVFPPTVNSAEADETVRWAGEKLGLEVIHKEKPFPWSEDFGHFTGRFGGALFGLGSGVNSPPLHSPDYDFPDQLTATGVNIFSAIIEGTLGT